VESAPVRGRPTRWASGRSAAQAGGRFSAREIGARHVSCSSSQQPRESQDVGGPSHPSPTQEDPNMKTISTSAARAQEERAWWVVDAADVPVGRLASKVAMVLRGKHKASFTPHVDTGDFVVVINADKVKMTGNKPSQHQYHTHGGRPG